MGVVIDLRGANGTDLESVADIAGVFAESGAMLFAVRDMDNQDIGVYKAKTQTILGMPAMVLVDRAATLSAQIAALRAAEAVVLGTALPLTKYRFRQLFTFTERVAVDALEANLEQHPGLTDEQRAIIRTGFRDFNAAQDVARPFLQPVLDMLDLFVSLGILTTERKAQIVSAGNG